MAWRRRVIKPNDGVLRMNSGGELESSSEQPTKSLIVFSMTAKIWHLLILLQGYQLHRCTKMQFH